MSSDNPVTGSVGKATGKLGALFSKKVMGVKVLYWLGIFALVLAFYAWKMRDTASDVDVAGDEAAEAADTNELTDEDSPGLASDTLYPTVGQGTVVVQQPTSQADDSNSAISTNAEWLSKGVAHLVQTKGISGSVAQQALQAYLTGGEMSTVQRTYVDSVIREYGLPPYADAITVTGNAGKKLKRYVRKAGTSGIYAQYDDDTLWLLSSAEYTRLGKPKFTEVVPSDPIWSFPRYNSAGKKYS